MKPISTVFFFFNRFINAVLFVYRRFVLVTQQHPEPNHPIPSPLERQLLKARFPKTKKHLLENPEVPIPRRHSTPNVSRVASVADFVM